ncbi:hypothetical protein K450DRAFT_184918 [Umbelopsis ramanniana AG]|uniref:Dienelactone hydrolase domain-containing protein n=1 Tax=Umbelopsis ramanniana AG TaxID=1314678 RepID=A0AAD5EEX1_UMBRA|nr:uncharacterized protein K450DRAFT_184918 [Umbelopsis ramanniana AG]KAI8582087.1 hypothetical protein K450DRAFT_184918 [Umbelopsis ramanniana AG]
MSGDKVICEDCVTGFLKTGETQGDIKTVGSVQAYFTPSSSHKSDKAIVIIGDIFGWEFINTRLYADEIARQTGFLVVVPDLMKGYAAPADALLKPPTGFVNSILHKAKMVPMIYSSGRAIMALKPEVVLDLAHAVLNDLRASYGIQSIGVHGFCFGGKYSILLGNKGPNDTPSPVQAFAAGHPSLLKIPGDVENIDPSIPAFLQYAESDFMVSEKNRQDIEQITKEKSLTNVKTKLYPGTKHGFCLKSNEDDEKERAIATEATTDAAQFFASKL